MTGSKLGEAMLELDRGLFGRSGSPPIAAHAPEPALRPPIAKPQRAPAPGSEPAGETTAASQAGLAKAEGDAGAVEGGASEHRRFSPAPRERAATPAAIATGWQALYAEGHRFQLHGNLVAAADAYRRALRLNPHHPAMLYDLGYVLQMQGQSEPAMDYYRQTIALEPDHAYAHYNLGYLLQERGKSMAASRHYEVAAARLPENAFVYYDWAWSLEFGRRPGRRGGALSEGDRDRSRPAPRLGCAPAPRGARRAGAPGVGRVRGRSGQAEANARPIHA